jgi:hypothetical protein
VDSGTRLLALSCFDHNRFVQGKKALEDDLLSFTSLDVEFTVEVIDVLHEYCFILRKLIERAEKIDIAREMFPHSNNLEIAEFSAIPARSDVGCNGR